MSHEQSHEQIFIEIIIKTSYILDVGLGHINYINYEI